MTFEEYQAAAAVFAVYQKAREREYLSLGLISEVGELAGKLKKEIRDGVDLTEAIKDEAGDIAWYAGQVIRINGWRYQFGEMACETAKFTEFGIVLDMALEAAELGNVFAMSRFMMRLESLCVMRNTTLEAVCERNIAKLQDRKNRDVIKGSGDTR